MAEQDRRLSETLTPSATPRLDHATIAGSDLAALRQAFADVGLATDYGGAHSNGVTHMALLGFDDGSYLELISTLEPGKQSPWWPQHIAADGGPCAWCARSDDLTTECARLSALGITVRGPIPFSRARPDGLPIEWDLAFIGAGEPGTLLPFLIQDRTPRHHRVRVSPGVAGTGLSGIARVIIGVRDLPRSTHLLERVYGWTATKERPNEMLDATIVQFDAGPVALATPRSSGSWLQSRLARFGDSPAAFVLRSRSLDATERRLSGATRATWIDRPALWLDPQRLQGTRLGIIEEDA